MNWHPNVSIATRSPGKQAVTTATGVATGLAARPAPSRSLSLSGATVARRAAAHEPAPAELAFGNHRPAALGTLTTAGARSSGATRSSRTCGNERTELRATCHRPGAEAWSITPAEVSRALDDADGGPRPGSFAPTTARTAGAAGRRLDDRAGGGDASSSLLLTQGPRFAAGARRYRPDAEFEIAAVDDLAPMRRALTSGVAILRRPLPTTNLSFLSAVMWDGRASVPGAIGQGRPRWRRPSTPPCSTPRRGARRPRSCARSSTSSSDCSPRSRGTRPPAASSRRGARGGPAAAGDASRSASASTIRSACVRPCPALAAAAGRLDPGAFSRLFGAWQHAEAPERQAMARGETHLQHAPSSVIDNVPAA